MRDMRRIRFYAGRNRSGNVLHVETDGAVINVSVGLEDAAGRQVTTISISPDDESRGGDGSGRTWHRAGDRVIRLHEGETELPRAGEHEAGRTDTDQRVLNAVAWMLCDPEWGAGMLEDIADLVRQTGRSVDNIPDPDDPESEGLATWERH